MMISMDMSLHDVSGVVGWCLGAYLFSAEEPSGALPYSGPNMPWNVPTAESDNDPTCEVRDHEQFSNIVTGRNV